ncbi:heat shock 70 kDa protein 18-like [Silene latifolia]|uniref:heat shock 70 kDa protein 18-like n=1 Tax=Silene latifolia TaxID=37657 RepID=UPI003D7754EC
MAGNIGDWPVIGIDLGTTNSCVAVWRQGHVEVIPNELGSRTTPSCVSFTDYERLFGEAAIYQASRNLANTVFDAKRLIGSRFSDNNVQDDTKRWPFKVIDGIDPDKQDQPMIVVKYMGEVKRFTPEEITAMNLADMKRVAEAFLGTTVNNAIITVPAHFNNWQRQATKDAGTIAGLNVIRLINEPTAAAIAYYCLDTKVNKICDTKKNVLVFDLGGGTFDVSLVEMEKGGIQVKSTVGDSHLGGTDFDNKMVGEFAKEFKQEHGKDVSNNHRALTRLRVASERAKRILSLLPQADVEIDYLFEGIDFSSTITRAHFEKLNLDLFGKCTDAVDQCLKFAGITKSDVDDVVLVGGSSRVPKVQQILKDYFDGKELCKSIHPDEAVACGAAMYAAILGGVVTRHKDFVLSDVTPLSVGVYNRDRTMDLLIRKNTTIPTKVNCCSQSDNTLYVHEEETQNTNGYFSKIINCIPSIIINHIPTKIMHHIFSIIMHHIPSKFCNYFSFNKTNYKLVGSFSFTEFPRGPRGTFELNVYFEIDVDGIWNVSESETMIQEMNPITIRKWNGRLSREDIERMIAEAERYKAHDRDRKKLLQAKSNLESYSNTILERLNKIGIVQNAREQRVREAVETTFQWMKLNSNLSEFSKYEDKLSELQYIVNN